MGYVVSTVKIVVDEDFPVAIDVVGSAIEVVQFADAERRDAFDKAAKKIREGRGVIVEVDEDKALPGFDSNWNEAVLSAIKIFDPFEFRHPLQRTVEAIIPAMVRTMQERRLAARLSHYSSGVVAANVIESA